MPALATPIFEDPGNTKIPQRIRFSFDVVFTDESAFPNVGSPPVTAVLNGAAQIGGANISGATCTTGFELLGGANPRFSNLDPSNSADLAYLSEDLRVFSVIAGQSPLSGAQAFTSDAYASHPELHQISERQHHLHPAQRRGPAGQPARPEQLRDGRQLGDAHRRRGPYRVQLRHRPGAAARHGARPGAQLPGVLPSVRRPVLRHRLPAFDYL